VTGPLDPPGRGLAWKNRRLLAVQLGWAAGAPEACERIEHQSGTRYPRPYGATPEDLEQEIKDAPDSFW